MEMDETQLGKKLADIDDFMGDTYRPGTPAPNAIHFLNCESRDGDELYFNHLLPHFLVFSEDEGLDLLNYNKESEHEPLRQKLPTIINEFNYHISPTTYNNKIYLIRCLEKNIGGLPKDYEARKHFLTKKASLFTYKAYELEEKDILNLGSDYIRLFNAQNESLKRKHKTQEMFIKIATIIILFASILWVFGVDG